MKKLFVAVLLVCSACSSPVIFLKPNTSLQRLGICFKRGHESLAPVADRVERSLDDFILRYNASATRKFELFKAAPGDSSTLTIELSATRLVTPGQQVAGVVVTLIGLSLPFIMIGADSEVILFFYYFPDVRSMMYLSLSQDIAHPVKGAKPFMLTSGGFLTSVERQMDKHALSFSRVLLTVVTQLERQAKK